MNLSVSGSTGLIGRELIDTFSGGDCTFRIINRDSFTLTDDEFREKKIEGADAVINLAGAPILKRWTENYRKEIAESRILTTRKIAKAIAAARIKPRVFISASATGIYDTVNLHDEQSQGFAGDFLGQICRQWEAEAMNAGGTTRVVIVRTGVVLSSKGGMLKTAYTPFRFGFGGVIGDGKQPFPFIHIRDLMKIYRFILENESIVGVVNAVAPESTTNLHFTKTFGKVLNQITIFRIPASVLRMIYGDAASILVEGQKVVPAKLMSAGFQFEFPTIEKAVLNLYRI